MPLRFLTAGESHGPCLTTILEGMPAGIPLCEKNIREDLARRQLATGAGGRMAIETDKAKILGGVMAGKTTGAPIALQIENRDFARWDGKKIPAYTTPRPGHADLAAVVKYGFDDIRFSLERASARETACRVAVGAVCRAFLHSFGIEVGGTVVSIGETRVSPNDVEPDLSRIALARGLPTQMPDAEADRRAREEIVRAKEAGETLGGVISVAAFSVPPGLGSYAAQDRRLDARLASVVMGIPAIKGVEIGDAFANAALPGTAAHDPIGLDPRKGTLKRLSNRCGGIEGGISNGETIFMRAAMKPIPTTLSPQSTVDLASGKETETRYERSDFCPVPRAVVVLEASMAYVLADALIEKLGGDSLREIKVRFRSLRKTTLTDCALSGKTRVFWNSAQ